MVKMRLMMGMIMVIKVMRFMIMNENRYNDHHHISFDCVATNGVPAAKPLEVRRTLFLLVHRESYHPDHLYCSLQF